MSATETLEARESQATFKRWLSVKTAAIYSEMSELSVRRLINAGKLTAHRPLRGKVLIDRIEFDALIQSSITSPRKGRGIRRRAASAASAS